MYDIVISELGPHSSAALLKQGQLTHFYYEDYRRRSLVGQIIYGTVLRVLAGTQSAFIDIGGSKTGFLHVKDCGDFVAHQPIERVLFPGQNILVQVLKDPIGEKGPRLTMEIALPSHYFIYHPFDQTLSFSQKIEDITEKERLREISKDFEHQGLIIRTSAQGVAREQLFEDYQFLATKWNKIRTHMLNVRKTPCVLWQDADLSQRIIRDFAKYGISSIQLSSTALKEKLVPFLKQYYPGLIEHLKVFEPRSHAWREYQISKQLLDSMQPVVPLKSGGSVIIESTESMVTIDVNTGTFTGKKNARETLLKTNLEAVAALAHQIPLRQLGGIIVIDFIDMHDPKDREAINQACYEAFRSDIMPVQVLAMSVLSLVQMTRKRQTSSSTQKNMLPCPCCQTPSKLIAPHIFLWIFLEKVDLVDYQPGKTLVIMGRPDVLSFLEQHEGLLKKYKGLDSMPWYYRKTDNHDNTLALRVFSDVDAALLENQKDC